MTPRLYWAVALPCSAARRYHRDRFGIILRHAFAGAVHDSEVVLGGGASLLGGAAEPGDRLGGIVWDAFTGGVPQPEVVLRLGVASLSESAQVGKFLC